MAKERLLKFQLKPYDWDMLHVMLGDYAEKQSLLRLGPTPQEIEALRRRLSRQVKKLGR